MGIKKKNKADGRGETEVLGKTNMGRKRSPAVTLQRAVPGGKEAAPRVWRGGPWPPRQGLLEPRGYSTHSFVLGMNEDGLGPKDETTLASQVSPLGLTESTAERR